MGAGFVLDLPRAVVEELVDRSDFVWVGGLKLEHSFIVQFRGEHVIRCESELVNNHCLKLTGCVHCPAGSLRAIDVEKAA